MIKILTNSKQETQKLAAAVARKLRGGEILALQGDLGSGKTAFVQGLGRALRIRERIQSPTFVIMVPHQIPRGKRMFFHLDLYRLQSPAAELHELGFTEIMRDKNNILAIEWAEKIRKILPKRTIWIKFEKMTKPRQRQIRLCLTG